MGSIRTVTGIKFTSVDKTFSLLVGILHAKCHFHIILPGLSHHSGALAQCNFGFFPVVLFYPCACSCSWRGIRQLTMEFECLCVEDGCDWGRMEIASRSPAREKALPSPLGHEKQET